MNVASVQRARVFLMMTPACNFRLTQLALGTSKTCVEAEENGRLDEDVCFLFAAKQPPRVDVL